MFVPCFFNFYPIMKKFTQEQFNALIEWARENTEFDEQPKDEMIFIDLGLPSGTKWANRNAEGFFTFEEAVEKFGNSLPSAAQMAELTLCKWEWVEYEDQPNGYKVTGPNGNSIFLPVTGWKDRDGDLSGVDYEGDYWTRTKNMNEESAYSYGLSFGSGNVRPLYGNGRAYGFAVRPVQE